MLISGRKQANYHPNLVEICIVVVNEYYIMIYLYFTPHQRPPSIKDHLAWRWSLQRGGLFSDLDLSNGLGTPRVQGPSSI